jgi:hypothetical protein
MTLAMQMNAFSFRQELLDLKQRTAWSWETMAREFERAMGVRGPAGSTLLRYAMGKVKKPNLIVEHYVREALRKVIMELKTRGTRK